MSREICLTASIFSMKSYIKHNLLLRREAEQKLRKNETVLWSVKKWDEDRNAVKFPHSVEDLAKVDDHELIKLSTYLTDHL